MAKGVTMTVAGREFRAPNWEGMAVAIAAAFAPVGGTPLAVPAAETAGKPETCPTFTLRADRPGHLRALLAGYMEMEAREDVDTAVRAIREFELWEERN